MLQLKNIVKVYGENTNMPVTALKGSIAKPRKPVSIEDMNAAIARRGSGRAVK